MSLIELEALSTKQLLARLKRLHQCEESLALSGREVKGRDYPGCIEFKQSPAWIAEYERVKDLLARREHVPKASELAELRKERRLYAKSLDRKSGTRRKS